MPSHSEEYQNTQTEAKNAQIEIERIRADAAAAAQQRRIQFWTMIFTTVMGTVVTPFLLYVFHTDTMKKVDAVKTDVSEVKQSADQAAQHAQAAVSLTRVESAKLDEKVDANLKQWKAYKTQEPDDMIVAAEALAKAEKKPSPPVAAAKGQ